MATLLAGGAAVVVAAVWAFLPNHLPLVPAGLEEVASAVEDSPTSEPSPRPHLDASAFEVRLWNAPMATDNSIASGDEPPLPTPNLELIAIITQDGQCLAALYDSTGDQLHIAGIGQHIGRLEIIQVDPGGVDLRDGSRNYRLKITPTPASSPREVALAGSEEGEP